MSESQPPSPPKRQRLAEDHEDAYSESSITALSERTRLSQPSGRKRLLSPVRDVLNDLRGSRPPIQCELPSAGTLPGRASSLQHHLMDNIESRLIPMALKKRIAEKHPSIATNIPDSAYDDSDTRPEQEIDSLWDSVEEILTESRDCGKYQQDESAWCLKVVYPLLRLALKGNTLLNVESVQTQTINPNVLPMASKNYRIQMKADYTFSFRRSAREVSHLYNRLDQAGLGDRIGQTMDANTKRLALFSGVEVKQENGGKDEALAQLSIWLAAGLETLKSLRDSGQTVGEELFPTLGWTVVGHDWHTYIAYMSEGLDSHAYNVVGPWRMAAADTRDVFCVFKLLKIVSRAIDFASKEYWTWLRDEVLMPCTSHL